MKKKTFSLIFLFLISLSFLSVQDDDDLPIAERGDDSPPTQECHYEYDVVWIYPGIGAVSVPIVYRYEVCD